MKPLSKTDYILYRECPKNVWTKIHKPDVYFGSELSEFEKSIIEAGNEVEGEARKIFPDGILIEGRGKEAEAETKERVADKTSVMFQPLFVRNGFLAAVDVLRHNAEDDSYSIYEIKASNEIDERIHFYDLAFQVNLLKRCGLKIKSANIIHLNSSYVRSGDLNISELFQIDDVTKEIEDISEGVNAEMEAALQYISNDAEPEGYCVCIYKGKSKHCTTFKASNPQVPEYSVHAISRIGSSKKKLRELIDRNIFHIKEVPSDMELSASQRNQVDAYISNKVLIDKDKIKGEFESLVFPLYFLDYETFPSALPRFDGFSPHQQIVFQYSLYVLHAPEEKPEHFEFLHTGHDDPSEHLVDSLKKHIGYLGSVVVWNKSFECSRNKELGERIPGAKSFMESINSRTYDLMDIFKNQYYVHKDFKGSTSIKSVLPVIVPELTYKDLEIREGGTASQRWNDIVSGDLGEGEKAKIAKDLKEYCGLDTYAMYAIWRELNKLI